MRILLTHTPAAFRNYYGDDALAALSAHGTVLRHAADAPLDVAGLIALARQAQVIVSDRQTPAPAALFDALPGLVAFVRCAMDIRNVDVAAASRAGTLVTRASAGFIDAVAELAIGFMIDLGRGISRSAQDYRAGRHPAIREGVQLAGATLGIIGYGAIGRRLARMAQALDMTVRVSDPFAGDPAPGIVRLDLADLLASSRFVVCLAPALPETVNLMNAQAFAAMPRDSFFINLARGELVDDAALAAALDAGHLAGAAIDVGRAPDQMPSRLLAGRPDVIATPHVGGLTPQAVRHQAFDTVAQVAAIAAGRMPPGAVNPDAAARLMR